MLTEFAIGDAYGRVFEFADRKFIDKNNDLQYHLRPKDEPNKLGIYTDDTQMTIAIAEHMIDMERISHERYAEYFLQAYKRDPRGGYSKRIKDLLSESKRSEDLVIRASTMVPRNSNGCVMRTLPIGLYPNVERVKQAAIIHCSLTHPGFQSVIATTAIALTVHYYYYKLYQGVTYVNWMKQQMGSSFDEVMNAWKTKEVPCDAMETAAFSILNSSMFKSMSAMLMNAIAVGGDTDSTAAISLGIAAVRGTENDLPKELYVGLENGAYGKDYISGLWDKLQQKYPRPVKAATKA